MVYPAWCLALILLTLSRLASSLEVIGFGRQEVTCPPGLSGCVAKDTRSFSSEPFRESVDVGGLKVEAALCCDKSKQCSPCLVTHLLIHLPPPDDDDDDEEPGGSAALDEEDEMSRSDSERSVTVCYVAASLFPACRRVTFTVNQPVHTPLREAQLSLVIFRPVGVLFGSSVSVYVQPSKLRLNQEVVVPSVDTVCSTQLDGYIEECDVPRLSVAVDLRSQEVELLLGGDRVSRPARLCSKYERDGRGQELHRGIIPLEAATSCMCFQAWWDREGERSHRATICPFMNRTGIFQVNVWKNISLTVNRSQLNNGAGVLSWSLAAPCRLMGEVWPCYGAAGRANRRFEEIKGFRLQLSNSTWNQDSKGLWEAQGYFEETDAVFPPCVTVKIAGMETSLGPFCIHDYTRWRWGLVVVGILLLLSLTSVSLLHLRKFSNIKQWAQTWHHGERKQYAVSGRGRLLLLSPPDVDGCVGALVCALGSRLREAGLAVALDLWSRAELCSLGPLPWLHAQMQQLERQGGHAVMVLTQRAWERSDEWSRRGGVWVGGVARPGGVAMAGGGAWGHRRDSWEHLDDRIRGGQATTGGVAGAGGGACGDRGASWECSPYGDVFTASLCCVQAYQRLGRKAAGRFLLVEFDSHPAKPPGWSGRTPELLRELPLFHLPSQARGLLSHLGVRAKGGALNGTAADVDKQLDGLKGLSLGTEMNWEMKPLRSHLTGMPLRTDR